MLKRNFVLASLFSLLVLPTIAQAFDITPYGVLSCEFGQCTVDVPAYQNQSKAECEKAYRIVYAELNKGDRIISNTTPCYDTAVLSGAGPDRVVHTKSFVGRITYAEGSCH